MAPFLANAGGLAVNLFGTATSDQLVQVVGSSLSIGSLVIAWLITTRKRIADDNRELARQEREEKRHQDQLDAMQKLDLLIRERQARELPVEKLQVSLARDVDGEGALISPQTDRNRHLEKA